MNSLTNKINRLAVMKVFLSVCKIADFQMLNFLEIHCYFIVDNICGYSLYHQRDLIVCSGHF